MRMPSTWCDVRAGRGGHTLGQQGSGLLLHTRGLSKQGDLRILGSKFLLLELAVVNVDKEKTRMSSMVLDKNWLDWGGLMIFNMYNRYKKII